LESGSKRPQARRRKPATRLDLQVLEDRTMPSAAMVETPPIVAALEQQAVHALVAVENAVNGLVTTAVQDIAQEEAYIVGEDAQLAQQWATLFKDIFGPQTTYSLSPTPSAGSGSGSGAATTAHNAANQQPNNAAQQSGNGSGSGASTTAHEKTPTKGIVKPMVSDTGSGSGSRSGSGVVQFGSATAIAYEMGSMCGSGNVTLPVDLEETLPYSVSVNYATSNGTATAGLDYTAESGTLTFAPGQTSQSIKIPILDDGNDESVGSENFYVTLSNPVNATIGAVNPCVVNIVEKEQNAADTLRWNPCMGKNSSTVQNWYDVTQGFQLQAGARGPNPSSPIQFDNAAADGPKISNAPIYWNQSVTVASISLTQYTGQQTIYKDVAVESKGANGTSLSMDGASILAVVFADASSVFQIDNNATITNMGIIGSFANGQFVIAGGTTMIGLQSSGAPYTDKIGVQFNINPGATLSDQGYNELTFQANGAVINDYGTMKVGYGTGAGSTLIDNAGFGNNYINVDGGTLTYFGAGGVTDTFNVPVYVQNAGTFSLTISNAAQKKTGGYLIVKDNSGYKFPNNSLESVYMSESPSSVQLAYGDTLECDNDSYQVDGYLETTDGTTCTLQEGANSGGTAVINGGFLQVNHPAGKGLQSSGVLKVKGNLNFAGQYDVGIQGNQSGQNGLLNVTGNMTLQAGNSLGVTINGALGNGNWTIIDTGPNQNIAQFTNGANPAPGLTGHNDQPLKGDYQVTKP
jgi:hypothetical protein